MALEMGLNTTEATTHKSGITTRAVTLGLIGVAVVGLGFPYANLVIQGTRPANTALGFGVIFIFLILVAILGPVASLVRKRAILSQAEWIVVFIMLLVASAVPTWGLVGQLLPIMTGAQYYATPSNRWAEDIVTNLPDWAVPKDPYVVNNFYEGLPRGDAIPWGGWGVPLLAWAVFIAGLYAATLGVTLLFSKHWTEHERLVYPLMRLPIEMVRGVGGKRIISDVFSNKLMWLGFLLAFAVSSYVGLCYYAKMLPLLPLRTSMNVPIQGENIFFRLWINPSVVAFTYMIHTDLAFSLWFFSVFTQFQNPLMRIWGIGLGAREVYGAGTPAISNQTMGAMIVLVVYGFYTARGPLAEIFSKAFSGAPVGRDEQGAASPQIIVGCLIFGFVVMGGWLYLAGMNVASIIVFMFGAFVTFIALTRATIQGGVPVSRAALVPQSFAATILGSRYIGPAGLTTLSMTFSWVADIRVFMMPFMAHAAKLWSEIRGRPRGFVSIIVVSIVVCAILATAITIYEGYNEGAVWLSSWLFSGCPQQAYMFADNHIHNPQGPSPSKMLFLGIGGAIMWGLTLLHYQLPRWPLHPLGFAVGPTTPCQDLWFSIFFGWLTKLIVLHLGGYRAFRIGMMIFLGMILGQFTACGVWAIIDGIIGTTDNMIYVY